MITSSCTSDCKFSQDEREFSLAKSKSKAINDEEDAAVSANGDDDNNERAGQQDRQRNPSARDRWRNQRQLHGRAARFDQSPAFLESHFLPFASSQPTQAQVSPLLPPASSLFTTLNGTGSLYLPPSIAHAGASQFASLTPDARACVTATYLCVLLVNNTWLDCNLLDTLCNPNGGNAVDSRERQSRGKSISASPPTGSTDSNHADGRQAIGWPTSRKQSGDNLADGALESALSGLIAFASVEGHLKSPLGRAQTIASQPRHLLEGTVGSAPAPPLDQSQSFQVSGWDGNPDGNSGEQRIYLLPMDLVQSLETDKKAELRAQMVPHDPGGGRQPPLLYLANDEKSTPAPVTGWQADFERPNGDQILEASSTNYQQAHLLRLEPERMERFVDENKNRIFEHYFKLRKHQTPTGYNNKRRNNQNLSASFNSSSNSSDENLAATSTTQPQQAQAATQTPSATSSTSVPILATASSAVSSTTASPMSLVSWVGRPFRGWSAYSFWPSNGLSEQSRVQAAHQVDSNSKLQPVPLQPHQQQQDLLEVPAMFAEPASRRPLGVQLLRPIDRAEQQFNDILTSLAPTTSGTRQSNVKLAPFHVANGANSLVLGHGHHSNKYDERQVDTFSTVPSSDLFVDDEQQHRERQSSAHVMLDNGGGGVSDVGGGGGGGDKGLNFGTTDRAVANGATVSPAVPAPPAIKPSDNGGMATSQSSLIGVFSIHQRSRQQASQAPIHQHLNHRHQSVCANCELTSDPSTCQLQCAGGNGEQFIETGGGPRKMVTSMPTEPSVILTMPNDDQQTLSSFVTQPTGGSGGSSSQAPPMTMISSPTTTTASTSIGPSGKMNPLDVNFLLYTRYHRDIVQELVHLNALTGGGASKHNLGAVSQLASSSSPSPLAMSSSSSSTSSSSSSSLSTLSSTSTSPSSPVSSTAALFANAGSMNPSDSLVSISDTIDLANETTLSESRLNSSLPFKIIVHGFGSGGRRPWVTDMVFKLLDYEDVNVIVVDWEKGAALPNYVNAAGNTRIVGHKIACLIKSINAKYGLTGNRYHLIGFSLGAHVAGFAGMEIRNSTAIARHWINRITGLDPASPLFEGYEANDRLDPSDAQFVDVIHSNGDGVLRGGFGSLQPMGHVDFYPNGGRVQVGCNSILLSALSDIIYGKWQSLCNHRRALNFFMDSFEFSKCSFRSFNCDSYENFLKGECFDCGQNNEKCSYMGYLANYSKGRGKMYLTTHEEAPFCANQFIIKIVGSKGYKTHWGKVEVTLVSLDGKNESFWLSSTMNSGQSSSSSLAALSPPASSSASSSSLLSAGTSASASSPGLSSVSSSPTLASSLTSSHSPLTTSASAFSVSSSAGSHDDSAAQRELNQQSMQSLIVAHPSLVNFTQILLRYTKYKGWIYSGDESWPIDKVFITDSDGQVKSFCGHNTVLESHITTRLNLEPGNCSVVEQQQANNNGPIAQTPLTSAGAQQARVSVGGVGGAVLTSSGVGLGTNGQQQQQQQQQAQQGQQQQQAQNSLQQSMLAPQIQQQHQHHQQSPRAPRLLASIMQSTVPANEHQLSQGAALLHSQTVAMQRLLLPQQLTLSSNGAGGLVGQIHQIAGF